MTAKQENNGQLAKEAVAKLAENYKKMFRLDNANAGCLCVEMECAAALAVTKFRGVPFAQFLYGADNLDSSEWEPRDLTEYGLSNAEKYFALALECAIAL